MKIGDEVYIHGYIDEIRKDTIIIHNKGGYFGTVQEEISVNPQEPSITWVTGSDGAKIAFKDVPAWKVIKICQILADVVEAEEDQEPKTDVLDKIRVEIEQTTSRYTISRERGAMGQVEWSDRLIKESEVLAILDKYKAESEE